MKRAIFVIGFSCCGKSYLVNDKLKNMYNVSDASVCDILAVQKTLWEDWEDPSPEQILESYKVLENKMIEVLKTSDTVIVEHTLLKAMRRAQYLDRLLEEYGDEVEIICHYFPLRDFESWLKNYNQRTKMEEITESNDVALHIFQQARQVFEIPRKDEGFDVIIEEKIRTINSDVKFRKENIER